MILLYSYQNQLNNLLNLHLNHLEALKYYLFSCLLFIIFYFVFKFEVGVGVGVEKLLIIIFCLCEQKIIIQRVFIIHCFGYVIRRLLFCIILLIYELDLMISNLRCSTLVLK